MIERLTATTFHRFLDTGRTAPALFSCKREAGGEQDYVVKLRGGMERPGGLLCELYASMLARYLGVNVPTPAVVFIEADLAGLIHEIERPRDAHRAGVIASSIGWNFGSRFLTNLATWPVDKQIPVGMKESAADVFAFDALIQNPDRSFRNPNLGICGGERGTEIIIYDHESAFSFLLEVLPTREPWKLETERYLDDHVFARRLKGERPSAGFMTQLQKVSEAVFSELSREIPTEWYADDLPRIEAHLRVMQAHAEEFAGEIERRLA